MLRFSAPFSRLAALSSLVLLFLAVTAHAAVQPAAPTLVLDGVGKGAVPLDGPWQFHIGDTPQGADPSLDDSHWEQLTAEKPWGQQGHANTDGFGWYRRHISVTPAPGALADFHLLIPAIDEAYEVYWNGRLVSRFGQMPPHWTAYLFVPAQIVNLGPIRSGVLAVRAWKSPAASNDDGTAGGFEAAPILGSPEAIALTKTSLDYRWLRSRQFNFGLTTIYTLTAILSFIVWLRDRKQKLLLWMAVYAFTPLIGNVLLGLRFPISLAAGTLLTQIYIQIREASQWLLLLWLLQLDENRRLMRLMRDVVLVILIASVLDGSLAYLYPQVFSAGAMQIVDAILTVIILPPELIPVGLVAYAVFTRKRLDFARWLVATFAFLHSTLYAVSNIGAQGCRFTHWDLWNRINTPLFQINGNPLNIEVVLQTLLFLSIVFAVIRYSVEYRRRQATLEQEFASARELQKVLVPDTLPAVPGFSLTSAYRPAREVGGDFFQIIPIESPGTGTPANLIVLGDVSGKGLKAAMAVSLIVGMVRALADEHPEPASLLTQLNRRLCGRMQGGFATCLALRVDADRTCTLASAGHPAPFINERELDVPGALPLGISPDCIYEEASVYLRTGDQFSLFTDGLLEARNASGELYSFARLQTLFATRPSAAQATDAAVAFGQDDDITVLTLTPLAAGEESTALHESPTLVPA